VAVHSSGKAGLGAVAVQLQRLWCLRCLSQLLVAGVRMSESVRGSGWCSCRGQCPAFAPTVAAPGPASSAKALPQPVQ
jgi:hypothetical protein